MKDGTFLDGKIEPGVDAAFANEHVAGISIAISLKRIADALNRAYPKLAVGPVHLFDQALSIAESGPNITYPSRPAAQHVRNTMRDLLAYMGVSR